MPLWGAVGAFSELLDGRVPPAQRGARPLPCPRPRSLGSVGRFFALSRVLGLLRCACVLSVRSARSLPSSLSSGSARARAGLTARLRSR